MKMAVSYSDNNNNNIVVIIIPCHSLLFSIFISKNVFFFHIGLAFALPFRNAVYSLSLDGKTLGRCSKKIVLTKG